MTDAERRFTSVRVEVRAGSNDKAADEVTTTWSAACFRDLSRRGSALCAFC